MSCHFDGERMGQNGHKEEEQMRLKVEEFFKEKGYEFMR
jgi:hypothetical protein